jgi:hypothetical protein
MAWVSLLAVVVMTLGPADLRPVTLAPPNLERLAAFVVVGTLFGTAYPRNVLVLVIALVCAAGLLEVSQHLVPNRHATALAFAFKAIGGGTGIFLGNLVANMARRPPRSPTQSPRSATSQIKSPLTKMANRCQCEMPVFSMCLPLLSCASVSRLDAISSADQPASSASRTSPRNSGMSANRQSTSRYGLQRDCGEATDK